MPNSTNHSKKSRRIWSVVGLVAGSVLALIGIWLVAAYFIGAVLERVGEPDQSLLFWYLPLLFMGIMATAAGVIVGALGFLGLRKARRQAL